MDTSRNPNLTERSIKRIWIKDGKRRMITDGGYMDLSSSLSKKMFGNLKQGRYSQLQDNK